MKLYLVNGESIISEEFNTDYLLQTFYEMKGNKKIEKQIVEFIKRRGLDNFILDSGAFSMFNGTGKLTYDGLKRYVDRYCEFIIKHKIKNFVEMDIDAVIGYEEAKKINRYIESRVGSKPMYVHHVESRTIEDLEKACKESDYLMWGGIAGKGKSVETINTFVDYCFDFGTRVHALGFTPLNLDECRNLYSCDSSSWTMGGRAGNIFQFANDKIDTMKAEGKKRITFYELNNHNMRQWIKYQQYLKNKGWITDD
jgi:hypothetical protein